jgi:hypothetical protein
MRLTAAGLNPSVPQAAGPWRGAALPGVPQGRRVAHSTLVYVLRFWNSAPMTRLEKTDWLDFALGALAARGHGALKAQTLAAGLGVTRGSFYWHFEDLEAFKRDLIDHWAAKTTEELLRA